MSVELSSPKGLLQQPTYHHVAVGGGRLMCMAGQVAFDSAGSLVASDLAGQIFASLTGIVTGLRSVGADATNLLRLTAFFVGWTPEKRDPLVEAIARAQAELGFPTPLPPLTVIGVQALYRPELLVEIEALAAVD